MMILEIRCNVCGEYIHVYVPNSKIRRWWFIGDLKGGLPIPYELEAARDMAKKAGAKLVDSSGKERIQCPGCGVEFELKYLFEDAKSDITENMEFWLGNIGSIPP